MSRGRMETLHEALTRLEKHGYCHAFRATPNGELEVRGEPAFAPETLVIEETVRFEGDSDPQDEAVLLALSTRDGRIRGTFVASYGPQVEPACAAAMHRLAPDPQREQATQTHP